tara:strand:+ start:720 stop:2420 length:1701 start_codon:yes stop_codon:yes gene_type:complete
MIDIFIFLFFFYFCFFSVLGYGLFFQKVIYSNFNKKLKKVELSFNGFYGLTLLTFISFITSFFFPHNFTHNIVLHIFGFLYFFSLSGFKNFRYVKYLLLISLLVLSSLFISKTHDDFSYYHFPFTKYLTEHHIIFGMGHLNLGYNLISSTFFLNSTFYLPIINYFSFHFTAIYFLIFFNFFLIENLFKKKNQKIIRYFCLVTFIFFNLSFNRISEYGTDKTGQLLIVILVIYLLNIILYDFKKDRIQKILLLLPLLGFCITLKTYFIPYIILSLSILLICKSIKKDFKLILNSKAFLFLIIILILNFSHHFVSNGCLISPLAASCFGERFVWAIKIDEIRELALWTEQWAKAGAGPNFRVDNPLVYIDGFNWIDNWFKKYFLIKFLDQILILVFSFTMFFLITKKFKIDNTSSLKFEIKKKFFIFYTLISLIFLVWLTNHPTLRYGGYSAFFLLLSIPLLILSNFFEDKKLSNKKMFYSLLIIFFLFNLKNFHRISQEFKRDDLYKFSNFPYFAIKDKEFKILEYNDINLYSAHHCWATPSPCGNINNEINVLKKGDYFFLFRDKN